MCALCACAFSLLALLFRCLACLLCFCRRRAKPEAAAEPLVPKTVVVVPAQQPFYPAPAPAAPMDPSKKLALDNLSASLSRGEITQAQYAQAIAALG